jgi:hypothetical protein
VQIEKNNSMKDLHQSKQRHGCVTAWLILLIIANSFSGLANLLLTQLIVDNSPIPVDASTIQILGIIGLFNIVFSVFLLLWKKWAFWGFLLTSIGTFAINVSSGASVLQSVLGLLGIVILFGVLQIKQEGVSAWSNLE